MSSRTSRARVASGFAVILVTASLAACGGSAPNGAVAEDGGAYGGGGGGAVSSLPADVMDGAAPPVTGSAPCAGRAPGIYCGARLGLDATRRYTCDGAPRALPYGVCDEGCDSAAAGTNDACFHASCTGRGDGLYCGDDKLNGNPVVLYRCGGGAVVSKVTCAASCASKPAGIDDACATDVPGAPTELRAAAGNGFAEVRWTPLDPPPPGGYTVTVSPGGATLHASVGDRSLDVPGLTNGTAYTFTVAAGSGPSSLASNAVTPDTTANVIADVGFHPQLRPLTCEEASLQMALEHAGIWKTEATILNDVGVDLRPSSVDSANVLHWGNPYTTFVGDPSGSEVTRTGYGTYYPNIARVAASYGAEVLQAGEDIAPETLYAAVLANHPAVVWVAYDWEYHPASMTWSTFDGKTLEWHGPVEHAITVVGVTRDEVLVNNPAHKTDWQRVPRAAFELGYSTYRNMAVILK